MALIHQHSTKILIVYFLLILHRRSSADRSEMIQIRADLIRADLDQDQKVLLIHRFGSRSSMDRSAFSLRLALVWISAIACIFSCQVLPSILAIKGAIIMAINHDQRRLILELPQDYPVSRDQRLRRLTGHPVPIVTGQDDLKPPIVTVSRLT